MKRLTEQYAVDDRVEIQFSHDADARWWAGRVIAHDPPGIWVELMQGQRFFVTNSRRIRTQT